MAFMSGRRCCRTQQQTNLVYMLYARCSYCMPGTVQIIWFWLGEGGLNPLRHWPCAVGLMAFFDFSNAVPVEFVRSGSGNQDGRFARETGSPLDHLRRTTMFTKRTTRDTNISIYAGQKEP